MLELSDESKRLVSTFFAYRNDIDIYTEDESKNKEFYNVLFSRILNPRIKINDITPLGSKKNVIQRCLENADNGRKKIFIVDGDINLISKKTIITHENLFIIDSYCIENLVFDETSAIAFIYQTCGTKSKTEIKDYLNFDTWISKYEELFIELFIHFGILDKINSRFSLESAYRFHTHSIFDDLALTKFIEKTKKEILTIIEENEYLDLCNKLRDEYPKNREILLKIVSGKDYLIPILLIKSTEFKKTKTHSSLEEIKLSMAQNCTLHRFEKLKDAIEKL